MDVSSCDSFAHPNPVKTAIDRQLIAVILIVAAMYAVMSMRFMDRLEPLTGDEPYYVMTALSLLRDHDLDESNNYANRDYDDFYPSDPLPSDWNGWPAFPRTLPPHPATTNLAGLHTKHGLGLTLLIAAPYAVGGRVGAMLVVLLCGVLLAANMYFLARDARATPVLAATLAVMLAIAMPIAPYAALLFPEVPAALLLVYAIRRLGSPSNSLLTWTLTGGALGFLPWLHQRFVPTTVVIVFITIVKLYKARDPLAAGLTLAPVAIGGISLMAYNFWLYDSPVQNTADHAGFSGLSGTINATFGLLLDAQWGLLIAAPVYLIAIVGIGSWWRVSRIARLAVLAIVPYLIVVASYRVWWGEWGPPARYLVPIAPFAAGTLAAILTRFNVRGRLAVFALWGIGMVLMMIGLLDPQRFYHQPDGVNNLYRVVDAWLGTHIANRLVAFQPFAMSSFAERLFAGLVLLVIMIAAAVATIRVEPGSGETKTTATATRGATRGD